MNEIRYNYLKQIINGGYILQERKRKLPSVDGSWMPIIYKMIKIHFNDVELLFNLRNSCSRNRIFTCSPEQKQQIEVFLSSYVRKVPVSPMPINTGFETLRVFRNAIHSQAHFIGKHILLTKQNSLSALYKPPTTLTDLHTIIASHRLVGNFLLAQKIARE